MKIPNEYLDIQPEDNTIATSIKNVDKIFENAIAEGKLFSELSVEWAVKTDPFIMKDYTCFELFKLD